MFISMGQLSRLVAMLLASVLTATSFAFAQDAGLQALGAQIESARAGGLETLSPKNFAAAVSAYEAALKDAQRGRSAERIRTRASDAQAALQRAEAAAAAARQVLGSVIKTREEAVIAKAPQLAPEQWSKAAQRFHQAMLENEAGDLEDARARAAEAEVLLRDAELVAIKAAVLNEARALIAQAEEARVERQAPRSLQAARRYLMEAEQEIQRNRYDLVLPQRLAEQARYEARHAMYLAQLIAELERQDQGAIEGMILSWEEPLREVASEMELSARFDQGIEPALKEMREHAQQQRQEINRLKLELEHRSEQISELNEEVDRLQARLGGVSEERIALQRRVDAQERLRASIATIESSFTSNEARVYRQGDSVVLSLLGINFPSGRSTIDAGSAALMAKVQQALSLFPDSSISVEGHTDANGSDSANLILSQDRADAVKQYLVGNFGLDPEKISSVGYGEARPVATNETADGRARNRRIDLVIHIDPLR